MSCEEAMAWEARVLVGEAEAAEAMERAGRALAEAIERDFAWWRPWPEVCRVLILAGRGHNAGDALLALSALAESDGLIEATILWGSGQEDLKPNLVIARQRLRDRLGENLTELDGAGSFESVLAGKRFDLTLDGLVGMQFRPPWRGAGATVVRWANENRDRLGFRVAVDLPSGMGDESAETIFGADVTYATGILKRPVVVEGAARWTGRVRLLDLGFFDGGVPADKHPTEWVGLNTLLRRIGRLRPAESDKRAFGQIFILGGSQRFPGAVLMATRAAVGAGAGLVTTLLPNSIAPYLASGAPEAMWMPLPSTTEGSFTSEAMRQLNRVLGDRGVLLIGPGLLSDRANTFLICRLIREVPHPLVLDAGALGADMVNALLGRPATSGPVILTPHLGEYERMLNHKVEGFDGRNFQAFCTKYRVTTILKGPVSRVSDGETLVHMPVGNPTLARGGSGDVLAGIVAARLAANPTDPLQAALEAVAWHGAAADALAVERGETGVRTTELLEFLSPVLRASW